MMFLSRLFRLFCMFVLVCSLVVVATIGAVIWSIEPQLPSTDSLRSVQFQVPLRVYSRDNQLIAEFGEQRRVPLTLEQIPQMLVDAVLAAEDERFYEHPGVDWQGLVRAVAHVVRTGEKGPGGSTITMQVARGFFLTPEKTYTRKLREIMLALKIDRELSKTEILELYLNKNFLGQRAYGVGAAAQVYYGSDLQQLSVAQLAMIAGLPKAPSAFNPIVNPSRALVRRNYVLGRMHELGIIDAELYEQAQSEPVTARAHELAAAEVEAPYVAEMARAFIEEKFGDEAYSRGFKVYTTIDSRLQRSANRALRTALRAYDERHGFRGPEDRLDVLPNDPAELDQMLSAYAGRGGLLPAVVLGAEDRVLRVYGKGVGQIDLDWEAISWARAYQDENHVGEEITSAAQVAQPGDIVRIDQTADGLWRLGQIPEVEGALVSLDPNDGSLLSLVGGFDFLKSKFNRVTQAQRQPGSSFKPFVYSAAVEKGFTAASVINDAPIVFDDPGLEAAWRPENYSGQFYGPTRLREALFRSRNLVSIRLLRTIGIDYAIEHVQRFGFAKERLPRDLSLSLGTGSVTPVHLVSAYAVLANGGYRVEPFFISSVSDASGETILKSQPNVVCRECGDVPAPIEVAPLDLLENQGRLLPPAEAAPLTAPRVASAQNIYIMNSMMRDVITRGTGARAKELNRNDLAGKTGTTNDQFDAWFSGFNGSVVTTAWIGFDKLAPLGNKETGGRAALPMWIDYMRDALDGVPESFLVQPAGLVTVQIDPESGLLARGDNPNAVPETFRSSLAPTEIASTPPPVFEPSEDGESGVATGTGSTTPAPSGNVTQDLF